MIALAHALHTHICEERPADAGISRLCVHTRTSTAPTMFIKTLQRRNNDSGSLSAHNDAVRALEYTSNVSYILKSSARIRREERHAISQTDDYIFAATETMLGERTERTRRQQHNP